MNSIKRRLKFLEKGNNPTFFFKNKERMIKLMKKCFITICACLLLASLLISFSSVTLVGCGDDEVVITTPFATATNTPSPTNTPSVTPTPTGGTINVTVQ